MYDRPTATELIEAACQHLEQNVIPAIKADRKLYFQTLVAINVLKIVGREIQHRLLHATDEWARLNLLEGVNTPLPATPEHYDQAIAGRNRDLCAAIRAGHYHDPSRRTALLAHLISTARAQLEVANPRFLEALAEEGN